MLGEKKKKTYRKFSPLSSKIKSQEKKSKKLKNKILYLFLFFLNGCISENNPEERLTLSLLYLISLTNFYFLHRTKHRNNKTG